MKRKLIALPTRCPVCDDKHTGANAVKLHNQLAATTGCRKYPARPTK